jgi:predicted TIM-barrel fold metal-dependent hydrolase
MLTPRRALLLGASLAAAALLALVLVPPLRALLDWVVVKVVAHRLLTVPLAALGALFVLAVWRRRFGWAALCALVAVGATGAYGLSRLNARFPANILTEPSSVGKVGRLLLGTDILLTEYDPLPMLVVDRAPVERARVPAIDVHFHLASLENVTPEELVRAMDAAGIERVVNLDGAPGEFDRFAREFRDRYPDRFLQFAVLALPSAQDVPEEQLSWIRLAASLGARGIKVHKYLGLGFRDSEGELVALDDARLDPIWKTAGELGLPVLIHTGDPTAFWLPVDSRNERFEELREFPDWSYHDGASVWNPERERLELVPYPTKQDLRRQRNNVFARHPETVFIGAHMGGSPEDLAAVAADLDRYPNYYVDIASRIPELGRQPYTARRFFIEYQDRILFATDGGYALGTTDWTAERYFRSYLEFLQTPNEHVEYPLWGVNRQGRWRVYGLDLPDDVLRKILHDNAARLLGLPPSTAP